MKFTQTLRPPMAIPFKTDQFRFRRQAELENEICNTFLFKKIETLGGREMVPELHLSQLARGLRLPQGFLSTLDAAALTLKTVARLPFDMRLCHACLGKSGGTSREQFEGEVLEMDRHAHPPLEKLPEEHARFTVAASVLAAHFIMEAAGTVTRKRLDVLLEFFELEPAELAEIVESTGWKRVDGSNTRQLLEELLTRRCTEWANIHCVVILRTAFLLALTEHEANIPEAVKPALIDLAGWCDLNKAEAAAVYESILETTRKGQNE